MPVFNTKKEFLLECLESIYAQTYKDFELVIINNGSDSEETNACLSEEAKKRNNIFIYNCERQSGKRNISIALNYGLRLCKNIFVARMDSDDIMLPSRLEKQLTYMLANDIDLCGTQIINTANGLKSNHPQIISKEIGRTSDWFLNHPTVMYRKDKILQIGGYEENIEYCPEDLLLWRKCIKNNYSIHNIQEALLKYRLHGNNLSQIDCKKAQWKKSILDSGKE
jgi:glycosyltransferase involved in cell wall biosynthesis